MSAQSQIDRLNAVKNRIRTNLVAQGITVPADTTLDEMATLILSVAGYTPEKGVDYWTQADQEAIVQDVIAALGTPVFGRVDAENNIILTGELVDGTYTFKYEDADGEVVVIGTLEHGGITNLANPSSSEWIENKRLNSSGAVVDSSYSTTYQGAITNFIPCKVGDVIRVKNFDARYYYNSQSGGTSRATAYFYKNDKSTIIAKNIPADGNGWVMENDILIYTVGTSLTAVSGSNSDICYVRLTGIYPIGYTANDVIITVNQEIADIKPSYTNQIPISTDTDGSIYNGKGYAGKSRFNSSGEVTSGDYYVTGFMPFTTGDVIRSSKGMFDANDSVGYPRVVLYDSNKGYLSDWRITPTTLNSKPDYVTVNAEGELWFNFDIAAIIGTSVANDTKFIRICASHIDDSSVITINEEIV